MCLEEDYDVTKKSYNFLVQITRQAGREGERVSMENVCVGRCDEKVNTEGDKIGKEVDGVVEDDE